MTTQLEQDVKLAKLIQIKTAGEIIYCAHKLVLDDKQIHAFANAIREQKVPQWISVKERLPDSETKQVFAWDYDEQRVACCEFPHGWQDMLKHDYITHWMPLPAAPTREEG